MADKPILFSGPMVRALIAGTKTQTRRLPSFSRYRGFTEFGPSDTKGYDWHLRDSGMRWHDLRHSELLGRLPWHFGDRLYVREHWRTVKQHDHLAPRDLHPSWTVEYLASDDGPCLTGKDRRAFHMPKWASRITLTVTDVRVQRLQDITRDDALAEGIFKSDDGFYRGADNHLGQAAPQPAYGDLWEAINGAGSWDANPWVAAYTFTVAMGNIDDLARSAC